MDDAINRVACHKTGVPCESECSDATLQTVEAFKATEEQKALTTEFFESYRAAFPDSNPLAVLVLVFSIDMKTWKFPEIFHYGPIAPQIEFIENNEALRKLMQEHCPNTKSDN